MLFTNHIPNIRRLIAESEEITYIARQHPLYGWEWLVAGFGFLLSGFVAAFYLPYLGWGLLAAAVISLIAYVIPFYYFEMAVTTHRFLAQQGRWHVEMEEILPIHFDHWELKQNVALGLIQAGHLVLYLRYGINNRNREFFWLHNPHALLSHLEKLNPNHADDFAGGKPKLPATVENQKTAPHPVEPAPPADPGHHDKAGAGAKPAPAAPRKSSPPTITGQSFAPGLQGPSGARPQLK